MSERDDEPEQGAAVTEPVADAARSGDGAEDRAVEPATEITGNRASETDFAEPIPAPGYSGADVERESPSLGLDEVIVEEMSPGLGVGEADVVIEGQGLEASSVDVVKDGRNSEARVHIVEVHGSYAGSGSTNIDSIDIEDDPRSASVVASGPTFVDAQDEPATSPSAVDEGEAAPEASPAELAGSGSEPALGSPEATNVPSDRLPMVLESLLFVADHPLTATELAALLDEPRKDAIEQALVSLALAWQERGVQLHNVAGGWQLRTNPRNAVWVQRMVARKPVRLTRSQLETLAICAYRQPITRPEIDEIRGVDSGGTLRTLLDRSLVRILGKKEEAGRPLLYGTTREFLEFFNLRDLRELPTLREFHELSDEHRAQVEALTQAAEAAGVGPDSPERPLPPLQRIELSDAPLEEDLGAVDALIQQAEARARTVVDALGGERDAGAAKDGPAGGQDGGPAGSSTAVTGADDGPGEPEL